MLPIRVIDERDVTPELDARIRAALVASFPRDAATFSRSRGWHGSMPAYSAVLETSGPGSQVIAHVSVVDRTVAVDGRPVRVAGVQNVCTVPEHRGKRLAERVLGVAMDEARRRGFDCGLLFCDRSMERVYGRGGWVALPRRTIVRVEAPGREVPMTILHGLMYLPLARPDFPPGEVHLRGNDW